LETPAEKTLIICLGREPASLYRYGEAYLYGNTSRETDAVLEAVYDGPIDVVGYEYSPVILERIPTLDNGDVKIESVSVARDEVYLDPGADEAANLNLGKTYLPSGCNTLDCAQKYGGGEVMLDRMVVTFRLKPGLLWSDGQPLTAGDSVFAFKVDSDAGTPTLKYQVDRTGSYEATDEVTLVWKGIPGYMDAEYPANFWPPLPEHLLGELSASDLTTSELTTRRPIGWGGYVIEEWTLGEQIVLSKNAQYFRAGEGLPRFDRLIFRFVGRDFPTAYQQLLTGECDILDESVLMDTSDPSSFDPQVLRQLKQGVEAGRIALSIMTGGEVERLDFNVSPENHLETPPLLADARTRKAIAQCIDREALISELLSGMGATSQTYLPPDHPLRASGLTPLGFDPAQATTLLEEVGWTDEDGLPETPRTARGIPGLANGTPLSLTIATAPGPLHEALGGRIVDDLAACGIGSSLERRPAEELLAAWPDGPIFGRRFQTALWSWPTWVRPACEMFSSTEIPSAASEFGVNATGYANPEYDRACQHVMFGPPEIASYREGAAQTQELFTLDLPALPLVFLPRLAAHSQTVCGLAADASAPSILWNIENLGGGGDCGTE
jgi:peptide/nickel transport system substrate-binding protein